MSVVNKMLQDLEARQSQTDEIQADYQPPKKKQPMLLILVLLILAIAAIIFALSDINQLFGENKKVTSSVNVQPVSPTVTQKMNLAPTRTSGDPVNPQKNAAQTINTDIELIANTRELVLESKLITGEKFQDPLHKNAPKVSIENLTTLQNTETQDRPLTTQGDTAASIQTTAEQTSSFSMTGSSQENNASSLKQRIAESLNEDNIDLARSLLYELLEIEADNIKARKKLASLLFAQGNYAQSKRLLVQGIELHPTQSDLRLMLARLHVVQKEPSQAMNILAEFQPNTDNQTEYFGYRAALAQQLKQTEVAKSDYRTLTNIEPKNAKWWLGLGIAEDQLGEIDMAVQAYTRAKSLGQLDSSVNDFMQQRISVLAGAQ